MTMRMAALLLAGALTAGCDTDAASAQNTGGRDTVTNSGNAPACSYATLSPEDQRRYKSRYERRVRTEGREFAEAWVRDRFCPPPEVQARRDAAKARGPVDRNGQPCTRTRAEMRAVTSMDGSMTMIPHQVCAD